MSRFRVGVATVSLALAAGCGGGYSAPSSPTTSNPPPATSPNTISIPSGARSLGTAGYAPNPITVAAGTTVTWTNNDTTGHTVTGDGGSFDSGAIAAGGSFQFTFQNRGTFAYHCTFHPGMVGSVVVQ